MGIFGVLLRTAGSDTITAADSVTGTINGTSAPVIVTGLAANHLSVTIPSTAITGNPIIITVTALDSFNNRAASYNGTVQFGSSDLSASLPANATLTNGQGTFGFTFKSPGSQTVTATDTNSGITGTSNASVVRGLTVTSLTPTPTGFVATFNKPFNPADQPLRRGRHQRARRRAAEHLPTRRRFRSTAR